MNGKAVIQSQRRMQWPSFGNDFHLLTLVNILVAKNYLSRQEPKDNILEIIWCTFDWGGLLPLKIVKATFQRAQRSTTVEKIRSFYKKRKECISIGKKLNFMKNGV